MSTINPTITDEMVEQVAEAMYVAERPAVGGDWGREGDAYRALYADGARAALEAAAPLIAAQALRDAADELRRLDDGRTGGYYEAGRHIIRRLDARADEIAGEQR